MTPMSHPGRIVDSDPQDTGKWVDFPSRRSRVRGPSSALHPSAPDCTNTQPTPRETAGALADHLHPGAPRCTPSRSGRGRILVASEKRPADDSRLSPRLTTRTPHEASGTPTRQPEHQAVAGETGAADADRETRRVISPRAVSAHGFAHARKQRAPTTEWHTAPDGRGFRTYLGECLCDGGYGCWQGRCECGEALTKHDFDRDSAIRCSLDALTRSDRWGHVCKRDAR